jgi:lysine-specific demethylase 8
MSYLLNKKIFDTMEGRYQSIDSQLNLSKNDFVNFYYNPQKPVLISQSAKNWPALKKWSTEFFEKNIGEKTITLNSFRYFSNKIVRTILPEMSIAEAIKTMNNNSNQDERYYLLRDSIPNNYPELLADIQDIPWLDSKIFCSRDLWFGDGLNITPLHFDAADNFVTSIFGSKTFYLYPPKNTDSLYPHNLLTQGRFNFSQVVSRSYASNQLFPLFFERDCYKVDIHPGDILYIPIGWWHEVHTHLNRSASITYFFNTREHRCLLWHFLGYQSCRLQEISTQIDIQNLLYSTNYSNALNFAFKIFEKKQYWLSIILVSAMLEHLLNLATQQYYVDIHKILKEHPYNPFVQELTQNEHWLTWERIISVAKNEDNTKFLDINVRNFLQEMSCFIKNIAEKLSLHTHEKYEPLIEVRNLSTLSSY